LSRATLFQFELSKSGRLFLRIFLSSSLLCCSFHLHPDTLAYLSLSCVSLCVSVWCASGYFPQFRGQFMLLPVVWPYVPRKQVLLTPLCICRAVANFPECGVRLWTLYAYLSCRHHLFMECGGTIVRYPVFLDHCCGLFPVDLYQLGASPSSILHSVVLLLAERVS
jgi:hypothetical protein